MTVKKTAKPKRRTVKKKTLPNFICAICGMRADDPTICTRDDCMTIITAKYVGVDRTQ